MEDLDYKTETQRQWNADPCGAVTAGDALEGSKEYFERVEHERYVVYAPWMHQVMPFSGQQNKKVLEIGPGLGTDHAQFARGGAEMYGIDLTVKHLELTRRRFALDGRKTRLVQGDAELLPFPSSVFDVVYSFGVLHHTPDTDKAIREVHRVLRPGGMAIISLYHRNSAFYWIYTLLGRGIVKAGLFTKGYRRLLSEVEHRSDPSSALPLVKVYSRRQCQRMFACFSDLSLRTNHIEPSHVVPFAGRYLRDMRGILEVVGRRFGWYLTVFAVKR